MAYPRKQYVLCRIRGRRTQFFYGLHLGELVKQHIKIGDEFYYAKQITGTWRSGRRTGENRYATEV